jgi:hypothetical protein
VYRCVIQVRNNNNKIFFSPVPRIHVCYKPGTRPFTLVVLFLLLCLFELRAHVDVTMVHVNYHVYVIHHSSIQPPSLWSRILKRN